MRESLEGTLYKTEFGRARISLDLFCIHFGSIASIHSSSGPHVHYLLRWGFRMNTLSDLHSMSDRLLVILHDTAGGCTTQGLANKKTMSALTPLADCFFCNIFTLHCCGSVTDLIKDRLRTDVGCISSPALLGKLHTIEMYPLGGPETDLRNCHIWSGFPDRWPVTCLNISNAEQGLGQIGISPWAFNSSIL